MVDPAKNGTYSSVEEAETDIQKRLETLSLDHSWLLDEFCEPVIQSWTGALTSFSANCTVSVEDGVLLDQIETVFESNADHLAEKAALVGCKGINQLGPEYALFIVQFRSLQKHVGATQNMNQHKLAVLLDGRYSIG